MRRLALYPIALLYGAIIWLRNRCFDLQLFKTHPIDGKSICVGNLAVGGTGKSPHVAYLIELLSERFAVQVLSRGYGRQTKGYIEITAHSSAKEVGDEPLMLFQTYQKLAQFAVCENRTFGVQQLRSQKPDSLILLDDAFQHRHVKAGLNIVLSVFDQPLHQDVLLPAGRLREPINGLNRADAIVITKCPKFDTFDTALYAQQFQKWPIPVFFSRYTYRALQPLGKIIPDVQEVLIVSGIALPEQLNEAFVPDIQIRHKSYSDHHVYTAANLEEIHHFFDTFATANTAIVTTAKDWVKIQSLLSPKELQKYPWYLLTFELEWSDQTAFNQFISAYVVSN
jgi:tetraacyldisaccharide 4'-kinase